MLENPQTLINIRNDTTVHLENSELIPDAIYIPFLNRYSNLNELLSSLKWYEREIIILMSYENGTTKIDTSNNYQIKFIHFSKSDIVNKIQKLKTFNLHQHIDNWDLPIKRNFALLHAIQNSYQNILLIDDDIEGITKKIIYRGIRALDSDNISGCLVQGYPDTSVIGHIEQQYGEPYFPFLSGNFLFICPKRTDGFFPMVYNEDWLFMIPSILQKKISAVDVIRQKKYNSFDDIYRIKLQEFGEIIAEGLFELISRNRFDGRFSSKFWNEYLNYRMSYVAELLELADNKFAPLLKESLAICKRITTKQCIDFIKAWEEDILTFNKFKINEG